MAIEISATDFWDTRIQTPSDARGLPYGMYFYYLGASEFDHEGKNNSEVVGHCPSIQALLYCPLLGLGYDNMNLVQIPYDTARFGKILGNEIGVEPIITGEPNVFRIKKYEDKNLFLMNFDTHKIPPLQNTFTWENESKLYQYPFFSLSVTDYINAPLEIKPHLCHDQKTSTLKGKIALSDKCTYAIYVEGYNGDMEGSTEAMVSNGGLDMPVSSSAYAQFSATSKAQYLASNKITQSETIASGVNTIGSLVGSALQGDVGGAISSGLGFVTGAVQSQYAINKMNEGMTTDLRNTPRSVKTMGGDVPFSKTNGGGKIDVLEYGLTDEMYDRIGTFFHMYGYKQDKVFQPNLRNRRFYNYVKTINASVDGSNLPKSALAKIQSIYNNGVTIWHVDREGTNPLDYVLDNTEI